MQICFVCNEYPPGPHGGIGTLTRTLARALADAGHRVRAVGVYFGSYPAPDQEGDRGVAVWRLRAKGGPGGWLRSRAKLFQTISRWVRAGEVDLIEVPDWEGWAAGWPALSVPVIARLSGSASYFAGELGRRVKRTTFWLERASLRRADFWCSESRYVAERTRQVFGLESAPDAVIYNPVETPSGAVPRMRSRNHVVFAGTLAEKKGIRSLVRAWPRVLEVRPDAVLHVFGRDGKGRDGQSMRAELESQLRGPGQESVHFRGHVSLEELLDAFQTARMAVLPSYAEGFSLTPLHAMACGCPTIYTCLGSGPETIEHARSGLLIDPDRPDDIAAAILRLISDDDLARRLGEAGRERVRTRFSLQVLMPQNEAFYRDCLARFSGKGRAA